jgi:hypothetical protein
MFRYWRRETKICTASGSDSARIDYCSNGTYTLNLFGQADANYVALASLGGNGKDDAWTYNIPANDKQTASFTLEVRFKGVKSDDSDNVQVAVMRLSQ